MVGTPRAIKTVLSVSVVNKCSAVVLLVLNLHLLILRRGVTGECGYGERMTTVRGEGALMRGAGQG